MTQIEIIEVGPRDGLQNQDAILSTEDKVRLIEQLLDAGAKRIEIASFVNPARVPQMAQAEDIIAAVEKRSNTTFIGLVLNERGLDRALETAIDEIGVVAIASDTFGIRNQKQTSHETVAMAKTVLRRAKEAGRSAQVTIGASFGCPFEGEVSEERVMAMAQALAEENPREIALADTIGVGIPKQVRSFAERFRRDLPSTPLRFHFHNTRNTGIANASAALEEGVIRLDASVGGIGGCPFAPHAAGNIATEDLIYLINRSGLATTYDLGRINGLSPWVREKLGLAQLPAMVSRVNEFPAKSV